MSLQSKARSQYTISQQQRNMQKAIGVLYSRDRIRNTPIAYVTPKYGNTPPSANDGYQKLNVGGGSMVGPLSFLQQNNVRIIPTNKIDISPSGAYTTYITLQLTDGTIDNIVNASNSGQLLIIEGGGSTTTFTQSGNIRLRSDSPNPFVLQGNDIVMFIWDASRLNWMQLTVPGVTSTGANTALSNLITTAINQSLLPATANNKNLGSITLWWNLLYLNTLHFTDTTDPNNKFSTVGYNTVSHFLEHDLTISGITAGEIFQYAGTPILGVMEGDNTLGDVAYVDFYQRNAYLNATSGGASALPGPPAVYVIVMRNGVKYKMALWNL